MNQTVRILDPNFPMQMGDSYQRDGKNLLRLLKANRVDKDVRDEVRVFLASRDSLIKKSSIHKEISRYANPLIMAGFGASTIGVYNPETIPVETYLRMKTDPQVAIGLAVIKMPLYALGWTIECEDKDIKEFMNAAITPIWRDVVRTMLTAVDFGFASHEKVFELVDMDITSQTASGRKKTHYRGKAEVYQKLKIHYPGSIRIRVDEKTETFLGINQTVGGQTVSLDANKCFMFSINDEFGNKFGQSRLKPAYKVWYWKEVLTQFMLRYFERRGSPTSLISHPIGGGIDLSGQKFDNSEIALRIGQNIIENGVVTVPFEIDPKSGTNMWDVKYLQDDRRGEMFVNALNYLGAQILRGLLTPERVMTQDLSTGSFSMASSHADIFLLSEEGLVSELEDSINKFLVPPLIEFNFQPNKVVPCKVRMEKIQYDRRIILKEILVEILRNVNTVTKLGKLPTLIPSIKEMSNILGVPLSLFEEEYVNDLNAINRQAGIQPTDGTKPGDGTEPTDKTKSTDKTGGDVSVGKSKAQKEPVKTKK